MDKLKLPVDVRCGRSLFVMTAKLLGIFLVTLFLISKLAKMGSEPLQSDGAKATFAAKAGTDSAVEPCKAIPDAPETSQTETLSASEPAYVEPSEVLPITSTTVSPNAAFADLRDRYDPTVWKPNTLHNEGSDTHYGGPWLPENVVCQADKLALVACEGTPYSRPTMGGLRTLDRYGYGRYETIMRPSGESGIVSACFTYTGPAFGMPHDEVDIEFAGNRPRYVEFNYFDAGRRGAHKRIRFGFDTS